MIQAISLAGELAALILAGAAGMFLARRRSVEFGLLSARGVGSLTIGARTAVEALLPALVGGVAGLVAASSLIRALGPGGAVDTVVFGTSAVRVVVAAVLAAVVVGALTAVAVRLDSPDRRARGPARSKVPWEIAFIALAAASAYEIFTRGGTGALDPATGGDEDLP